MDSKVSKFGIGPVGAVQLASACGFFIGAFFMFALMRPESAESVTTASVAADVSLQLEAMKKEMNAELAKFEAKLDGKFIGKLGETGLLLTEHKQRSTQIFETLVDKFEKLAQEVDALGAANTRQEQKSAEQKRLFCEG